MNRSFITALIVLAGLAAGGCAGMRGQSAYTGQTSRTRDSAAADALNREGADLIAHDPARAESLLRRALAADLYHGPAHNNLGILLLAKGELYEAAGEFEWARKLIPGHPDPRLNLALTLERAGRTDEALATYKTALEVYPDHLPTLQALTRLQVRSGRTGDLTPRNLGEIALRGESEEWRAWARFELARLP